MIRQDYINLFKWVAFIGVIIVILLIIKTQYEKSIYAGYTKRKLLSIYNDLFTKEWRESFREWFKNTEEGQIEVQNVLQRHPNITEEEAINRLLEWYDKNTDITPLNWGENGLGWFGKVNNELGINLKAYPKVYDLYPLIINKKDFSLKLLSFL